MSRLDQLCDQGADAYERGAYGQSVSLADQALRIDPACSEAVILKSMALSAMDKADEARATWKQALRRSPNDAALQLDLAAFLLGGAERASEELEETQHILERVEKLPEFRRDRGLQAEVWALRGQWCDRVADLPGALAAYEKAVRLLPEDPELRVEYGIALFEMLQFDAAEKEFLAVAPELPDEAAIPYFRGLIAERRGNHELAAKLLARATEIDPDTYPTPVEITREDFDRAVEMALAGVPDKVRRYLSNVPVLVEDLPQLDDLRGQTRLSPSSLGMFRGISIGEQSVSDPWVQLPSSIVLFQTNLQRSAATRDELLEAIETTLLHEVGHYVGWDEDEVAKNGLE